MGLNYIRLKFYVCIKHLLEVKVIVRDLKTALCFGLVAATVSGDRTVRSCRHSKSSAWARSICCAWRPQCVQL